MLRTLIFIALLLCPILATADGATNLFFLHHSTGRNMLDEGDARATIASMNSRQGTSYELWDHDYNHIGLRDPQGGYVGTYSIPDDNTDPDGLHQLWTTSNPARDAILANHQVIAFKSCYPASDITSDAMLEERKGWYLEMRDVFDQHPDKVFVVMSQPPRHRLATTVAQADRARAFAEWLGSPEFLAGHANIVSFDFFTLLAKADDGSETRNMLRYEYERSHSNDDSHPNMLANQTVCPLFVAFLIETASSIPTPAEDMSFGELKTMFR